MNGVEVFFVFLTVAFSSPCVCEMDDSEDCLCVCVSLPCDLSVCARIFCELALAVT